MSNHFVVILGHGHFNMQRCQEGNHQHRTQQLVLCRSLHLDNYLANRSSSLQLLECLRSLLKRVGLIDYDSQLLVYAPISHLGWLIRVWHGKEVLELPLATTQKAWYQLHLQKLGQE